MAADYNRTWTPLPHVDRQDMHPKTFFDEVVKIAQSIDISGIENLARELAALRGRGGRLFFLGVGGSAANCNHAVNDFRKLSGIEAHTPLAKLRAPPPH